MQMHIVHLQKPLIPIFHILQVCVYNHLFLQLVDKADGVGERLSLVTCQRLQVQDSLRALGLEDGDGLQQPLITDVEGAKFRRERKARDSLHYLT